MGGEKLSTIVTYSDSLLTTPKKTYDGKSTINEDVCPIENGDFPMSFVSFQVRKWFF